jgi:hypothetical protein
MADQQPSIMGPSASPQERNTVAVTVLAVSGGGIIAFAVVALIENPGEAMNIFNVLLPVLGTWVGTVLAFYFSRQNFVAASQSVTEMARQVSAPPGLGGPKYVKEKMIPLKTMVVYSYEGDKGESREEIAKKIAIESLLSVYKAGEKTRLPVLDRQKRPIYVIQWKEIDKYWAGQASIPRGSLQEMFDNVPGMKDRFSYATGFVTVKPDDTLAEAEKKMKAVHDCKDAIVTATGTADDAVIGWLTDAIIRESAKF